MNVRSSHYVIIDIISWVVDILPSIFSFCITMLNLFLRILRFQGPVYVGFRSLFEAIPHRCPKNRISRYFGSGFLKISPYSHKNTEYNGKIFRDRFCPSRYSVTQNILKASRYMFLRCEIDAIRCLQYSQLRTELDHDRDRRHDVVP